MRAGALACRVAIKNHTYIKTKTNKYVNDEEMTYKQQRNIHEIKNHFRSLLSGLGTARKKASGGL